MVEHREHRKHQQPSRYRVYFVQAGESGPIKIGFSAIGARRRLLTLQTAHYEKLVLLAEVHGHDKGDERALHKRFAHLHIRGEWFRPGADLLEYIGIAIGSKLHEGEPAI